MFTQETKDYAIALHRLSCNGNHADQCGWFYGEIQREYDYKAAEKLMPSLKSASISVEQIHTLADILRPWTKDWR